MGPGERGEVASLYAAGQDHSGGVKHPQHRNQCDRLLMDKRLRCYSFVSAQLWSDLHLLAVGLQEWVRYMGESLGSVSKRSLSYLIMAGVLGVVAQGSR